MVSAAHILVLVIPLVGIILLVIGLRYKPASERRSVPTGESRHGRAIVALIIGLLSLAWFLWGLFILWAQHSGIRASVHVLECGRLTGCRALWQPTDTIDERLTLVGADGTDSGHNVDVHIHGGYAFTNSVFTPILAVGLGGAGLGLAGPIRRAAS
jgi:hypothetical protein